MSDLTAVLPAPVTTYSGANAPSVATDSTDFSETEGETFAEVAERVMPVLVSETDTEAVVEDLSDEETEEALSSTNGEPIAIAWDVWGQLRTVDEVDQSQTKTVEAPPEEAASQPDVVAPASSSPEIPSEPPNSLAGESSSAPENAEEGPSAPRTDFTIDTTARAEVEQDTELTPQTPAQTNQEAVTQTAPASEQVGSSESAKAEIVQPKGPAAEQATPAATPNMVTAPTTPPTATAANFETALSEAQSMAQPEAPVWKQLATALKPVRLLSDGSQRLSVELHPAELGSVHLEVSLKDGVLSIRAVAEHVLGRDALQSSLPDLRGELTKAGVQLGNVDVGDKTSSGDQGNTEAQQAPHVMGHDAGESATNPSAAHGTPVENTPIRVGPGALSMDL